MSVTLISQGEDELIQAQNTLGKKYVGFPGCLNVQMLSCFRCFKCFCGILWMQSFYLSFTSDRRAELGKKYSVLLLNFFGKLFVNILISVLLNSEKLP